MVRFRGVLVEFLVHILKMIDDSGIKNCASNMQCTQIEACYTLAYG